MHDIDDTQLVSDMLEAWSNSNGNLRDSMRAVLAVVRDRDASLVSSLREELDHSVAATTAWRNCANRFQLRLRATEASLTMAQARLARLKIESLSEDTLSTNLEEY